MTLGALGSIFLILGFHTPILYSREKGDVDEMKAATTETIRLAASQLYNVQRSMHFYHKKQLTVSTLD